MLVNNTTESHNDETKPSTRSRVLAILRNEQKAVSGEAMAAALGLSRVAVWKAIKSLNEAGYRIEGGTDGYFLEYDSSDSIQPWEFGNGERHIRHYDEIGSTMDKARDEALAGCEDGLVVLAERQSAGRGTGEKKWDSPDGGLFFTMVTRPTIGAAWSHRLVLRAQLAMADAIKDVSGMDAFPGWPNDILLGNGKAGGILAETLSSGNTISFLDLGIGINTGTPPALGNAEAERSLAAACIPAGRKQILDAFLSEFRSAAREFDPFDHEDSLVRAWNARCPVVGKSVDFQIVTPYGITGGPGSMETGLFRGIDPAGWAVIDQNGETTHCPPGSITLRNKGIHS